MFSKACEYGIRACVFHFVAVYGGVALNSVDHKRVSLKEIANSIQAPEPFTAKILQKLAKNGIIYSTQGAHGGFEMENDKLKTTSLEQIVIAMDGNASFKVCVLGLKECSDVNSCPAHKKYKHIKEDFKNMIKTTSVFEIVTDTILYFGKLCTAPLNFHFRLQSLMTLSPRSLSLSNGSKWNRLFKN